MHFRDSLLYDRDIIFIEDVKASLLSKELIKKHIIRNVSGGQAKISLLEGALMKRNQIIY